MHHELRVNSPARSMNHHQHKHKLLKYVDSITSKFRDSFADLERESQEYRTRLANLRIISANLTQRQRVLEQQYTTETSRSTPPSTTLLASSSNTLPTTVTSTISSLDNPSTRITTNTTTCDSKEPLDTARYTTISSGRCHHCRKNHSKQHSHTLTTGNRHSIIRHNRIMTASSRGALIVFEGLDRVGKSTLATKLVEHLQGLKRDVSLCRFPERTTPVGSLIDDILKSSSKRFDNHVVHLLFSANRWEMAKKIRNTINQGTTVVVDRYSYSGIAYSAAKSGMDIKWCSEMEVGLPRPDLVIYLELAREAQVRRPGFGDERFETVEMQEKVRLEYHKVMEMSQESWLKIDVDGKSPTQLLAEIIPPVKRSIEACALNELGDLKFL